MVDSTVLGYMNAMYSVNANYTIEAFDAMGTCGYPVGNQYKYSTISRFYDGVLDALDECDAAAETLKCSMERNEEMANDLIRAVTSDSEVLVC
jgi:hypothetical protein